MTLTCDYCGSSITEADKRCGNCGAPAARDQSGLPDFRSCPFCHRRLLALASPACSYCGRRLPDEYIKAREADLKRVAEIRDGAETKDVDRKVDELIRQTAHGRASSSLGVFDISSLTDLFS
jgi:DNA-directed RNA polymerase subunit RPC12/RpoP